MKTNKQATRPSMPKKQGNPRNSEKTEKSRNQQPKKKGTYSRPKAPNASRKPSRKPSVVKYWNKNPVDEYYKTIAELYQDMAVYCDGICTLARKMSDRIDSTDIEPTHHTYISKSAKSIIANCEQIVDYIGNLGDLS